MSPSIRRNRPDLSDSNNRRSELEWSNSNSTANLFLGGVAVRRSWMLDASSQSSSSAPSFAPSVAAAAPITAPAAHHTPPSSSLSPSISASASAATVLDESGGPRGMQNFPLPSVSVVSQVQKDKTKKNNHVSIALASTAPAATASAIATTILPSTPPVWMPPVTTEVNSHNAQRISSPSLNTLLSSTTSAPSPTIVSGSIPPTNGSTLALDAPQLSQSSLPSPDPSSTPHPSPISIGDRNETRLSQSVLPSPPPPPAPAAAPGPIPRHIQPRPRTSQIRGTTPANASPMTSGRRRRTAASPLVQGFQGQQVNATSPHTPVHVNPGQPRFPTAMAPSPVTQASASPVSQPTPTCSFDQAFWTHSQMILNSIVAGTHGTMVLSETVEQPRIRLLQDACNSRDLLYLILHQIYCLHTFAPSEFARLPYLTRKHSAGFEILKQLLVDNHRLSGDFLRWSVHFPRPLGVMLQTPEFDKALHQIANCLDLLSEKWAAFDHHVRERVYPPLIDELVTEFGLTSTVLLFIVFLAMSRRIFGIQHQERSESLFEQNKRNYFKRFKTRVTLEQMNRENEYLIRAYKSLSRPQMSTTGQHASPAAELQVATQSLYSHHRRPSIPSANGHSTSITDPGPPMPSPQMPLSTTGESLHSPASAPLSRLTPGNTPSEGQTPYPALGQAGIPSPQLSSRTGTVPPRMTTALSTHPMPSNHPTSHHSLPPRPNLRQHEYNSPYQVPTSQSLGTSSNSSVLFSAPIAHISPVLPVQSVPFQQPVHQNAPQQHASPISVRPPMRRSATQLQEQMQRPQQVQSAQQVQQLQQPPPPPPPPPQPPQSATGSNLLLSPLGSLPTNTTRPHPLRVAVHQAHLRDPIIKWNSSRSTSEKDSNLFYYSKSFLIPPTPLGKTDSAFEWQFTLTNADIERLPRIHSRGGGQRSIRTLVDDNQLYRLRCIRVSPSVNEVTQHTWCATESAWPSVIYIFVNGTELFVRRKFHNGKDIPLDITEHLREGLNTISLHFIRSAAECNDLVYALGVEIMKISGFAQVKKLAPVLSASESRERIQNRLASSAADEELSIVTDYLTVNLIDPFMARIFNIPARGSICEHVECFDFETYILTRASKAGKTGLKENWKCPICGSDARPPNLVIDGFLAEVHAELQRTNRLDDARAIRIKAGGSWELKNDGEDNSSDKGAEQTPSAPSLKRKRDGPLMSPLAQRPKTESIGQGSPTYAESSASGVIELD